MEIVNWSCESMLRVIRADLCAEVSIIHNNFLYDYEEAFINKFGPH